MSSAYLTEFKNIKDKIRSQTAFSFIFVNLSGWNIVGRAYDSWIIKEFQNSSHLRILQEFRSVFEEYIFSTFIDWCLLGSSHCHSISWNKPFDQDYRNKYNLIVTRLMFSEKRFVIKHCSMAYSRLRNKHRGTLINFWTFFQGLCSLLERVMHFFFQNILHLMVWGMPILRATLNVFARCSRGFVYSRG